MTGTNNTLENALRAAEECEKCLLLLQKTCCIQERSQKMDSLVEQVRSLAKNLKGASPSHSNLAEETLHQVEEVGTALGKLYATCCTPTRERLYIRMYRSLGTINLAMWKIKGVSH